MNVKPYIIIIMYKSLKYNTKYPSIDHLDKGLTMTAISIYNYCNFNKLRLIY